jgi:hypothetical protein
MSDFHIHHAILKSNGWTPEEFHQELITIHNAIMSAAAYRNTSIIYHLTDRTRLIAPHLLCELRNSQLRVMRINLCLKTDDYDLSKHQCVHTAKREPCLGYEVLIISWDACSNV